MGYQDEIARVASACHQIDVFSRVLKTSIQSFLDDSDEFMQERLEEFTVWFHFKTKINKLEIFAS